MKPSISQTSPLPTTLPSLPILLPLLSPVLPVLDLISITNANNKKLPELNKTNWITLEKEKVEQELPLQLLLKLVRKGKLGTRKERNVLEVTGTSIKG